MIKPVGNFVMLVRDKNPEKIGVIYLPDSAKEEFFTGTVTAVGNGKKNENGNYTPINLEIGDKISFEQYEGTELYISEEKFLIIDADKIYIKYE